MGTPDVSCVEHAGDCDAIVESSCVGSVHPLCYLCQSFDLRDPSFAVPEGVDKGRFGSYLKLCDFTLLFMNLQVELRLNKRIISETQTS